MDARMEQCREYILGYESTDFMARRAKLLEEIKAATDEKKMSTRDELQKTIDAGQAAQAALDKLIAQEGLTLTDVLDGFAAGKAYRHREWPEGFCVVCSEWQIDAPPPYGAAIISYTLMLCTPCGAPAFDDTITLRGGREKIEASMRCLFAHENGWEEVK